MPADVTGGHRPERHGTGQRTPRMRASDAEREAVVERLSQATAEGRLTLEELADRSEAAFLARHRDDLDRIAADLPQPGQETRQARLTKGPAVFRATTGDVTHESPALGTSGEVEATAVLGDLTLNLAHAQAPPSGELRVTAKAWAGDVKLIVPEGVTVETSGSVRDRTRRRTHDVPPGAPRVHVKGTAYLGEITVVRPRGNRRTTWREWIDEALDTATEFL
ncbi:DUF1707 domain-containing protein [Streptomyces iconiensis]|uniref:DUF1707 domain-containing protein n=1 Tax=Streptomyces iconiensis TaxID=1384038 RepID=A0ABT7A1V5_9ACTN|nr:DUF1707 domain-containing protein [Streptomyces iconiensis]MDJ1135291.1 DUF1707 domain-containing protein [Streptomyces iconiensis]